MTIISSSLYFLSGFILAFLFPRMPGLLVTRGKGFNLNFPPHPEPIPLSPHLTQRVLHMRMFFWLGLFVSIIPLTFGILSVKWGNVPFGFGLWLSSGWFLISRLQVFIGGPSPPWTLEMAQRLQIVSDSRKSDSRCCESSSPEWLLSGIFCSVCRKKLDSMPRPDLGRKRSDGFFMGSLRVIASDGNPIFISDDKKDFDIQFSESE